MEYSTVAYIVHEYIKSNHKSPFFISDWDCTDNLIYRPEVILEDSLKKSLTNMDRYFFIEDDFGKDNVIQFFNNSHINLEKNSFLIGPNASLMLTTAFIALKDMGIENVLIILPVYFSVPQILRILDIKYIKYNTIFPKYRLDIEDIKSILQGTSVDAVIITDPFYGSGINVSLNFYDTLINYLNEHNIYLIVDYARGAMKWDSNASLLFDFPLYNVLQKANNYILVESISKRIFVNGFKNSLLFSNYNMIQKIRKLGDCFIGSMSAAQMEFLNNLYSISNIEIINDIIKKNISKAKKHFELIKTLLLGTDIIYTVPTDGNYILIGIPKSHYENANDTNIFHKILYDLDIYTLPQSLYAFEDAQYYIFRVNLLLNIETLVLAIQRLLLN